MSTYKNLLSAPPSSRPLRTTFQGAANPNANKNACSDPFLSLPLRPLRSPQNLAERHCFSGFLGQPAFIHIEDDSLLGPGFGFELRPLLCIPLGNFLLVALPRLTHWLLRAPAQSAQQPPDLRGTGLLGQGLSHQANQPAARSKDRCSRHVRSVRDAPLLPAPQCPPR